MTQQAAELQVGLPKNLSSQFQMAAPAFEPLQPNSQQDVTVNFDAQQLLTGCENAGMLQDVQPQVTGLGAELFGAACDGISTVTTEVNADFLQPMNVPAPTPVLDTSLQPEDVKYTLAHDNVAPPAPGM